MKKILLICILSTVTLAGRCPEYRALYIQPGERTDPYKTIFEAVCTIESRNDPNAYNPKERATGIAQVRPVRIRDFNNRCGTNYKLFEMYDPAKAKIVFYYYAKKIGWHNKEKIIRCWNGGENGMRYKQTKVYYQKVNTILVKK